MNVSASWLMHHLCVKCVVRIRIGGGRSIWLKIREIRYYDDSFIGFDSGNRKHSFGAAQIMEVR